MKPITKHPDRCPFYFGPYNTVPETYLNDSCQISVWYSTRFLKKRAECSALPDFILIICILPYKEYEYALRLY